jgi:hypothetical protein
MRLRAALTAATTLAGLVSVAAPLTGAHAVAKACKLITDDAGDSVYNNVPGDDSVDIVGGDFASNAKKITAIVRVKQFTDPDPQSPLGQIYFVVFTVRGVPDELTLSANFLPNGVSYKYGYQGTDPASGLNTSYTLGDATGTRVGNEIRISVDVAKYPQAKKMKVGTAVTAITAEARRLHGQRVVPSQDTPVGVRAPLGGVTTTWDDAAGKKYTLGAPSCVAVGK